MFSTCPKTGKFSAKFILSSADAFDLDQSKILLLGKELTLSKMSNVRLFQTERVGERTILNLMKMAESYSYKYKTLREKGKLLDASNFSFSLSVFVRLIHRHVKTRAGSEKG